VSVDASTVASITSTVPVSASRSSGTALRPQQSVTTFPIGQASVAAETCLPSAPLRNRSGEKRRRAATSVQNHRPGDSAVISPRLPTSPAVEKQIPIITDTPTTIAPTANSNTTEQAGCTTPATADVLRLLDTSLSALDTATQTTTVNGMTAESNTECHKHVANHTEASLSTSNQQQLLDSPHDTNAGQLSVVKATLYNASCNVIRT